MHVAPFILSLSGSGSPGPLAQETLVCWLNGIHQYSR